MNEFKPIFPGNEENENAGSKASCVIIWSGKKLRFLRQEEQEFMWIVYRKWNWFKNSKEVVCNFSKDEHTYSMNRM